MVDQFDLSKNEYLIVTSGAIAAGMSGLSLQKRPSDVPAMQACAAVGQSKLMHTYERLFFGKKVVAQLLLSSDDFTSPVRYRNLQNALAELLALGVVPIVNENDSVSVRELEGAFGDNDELSSLLATAVKADWLLLLTNVDGFLVPNGRKKPRLQRVVRKLTPALEAQCNGKSSLGRGGMISKLRAAKLASEGGVHVAIVNGRHPASDYRWHGAENRHILSAEKIDNAKLTHVSEIMARHSSPAAATTQEKLLRARAASARLALLSTEEKNALLLAIADAHRSSAKKAFSPRTARTSKIPASKARCATAFC